MVEATGADHHPALNILVIGGGPAGLSAAFCLGRAGHKITLIEASAAWPTEVGAGVQLGPNVSRLLARWGLREQLDSCAVQPLSASFHRYDDDEQVGLNPYGEHVQNRYGFSYYHIHRQDLIDMLYALALPHMIVMRDRVISVQSHPLPSVTLESGMVLTGDLIVGADGIKSVTRKFLFGNNDKPVPTGDLAYRALISTQKMRGDPDLKALMDNPQTTCWIGPGRHIVGYCISLKDQYNLVMICPDTDSEESWTASADIRDARKMYSGWNNRVQKILGLADSTLKSKLVVRPPLELWSDDSRRITLVGDACHSMLPYFAQGAAMAIEDSTVLGVLFTRVSSVSDIGLLLKGYQQIREQRTRAVQTASQRLQKLFHLPDGPEQQRRDAEMQSNVARLATAEARDDNPAKNGEPLDWIFDYDAEAAALQWITMKLQTHA